jgi:hypothetical protein
MHRILVKSNRKSAVAGTIYPGLNPRKIHEKFVMENVALGRVSYEYFGVPLPFTIPPVPHSNQSAWAGARDVLKAAERHQQYPFPSASTRTLICLTLKQLRYTCILLLAYRCVST